MACTVFGEARGESFKGKLAVAFTIVNRAKRKRWYGEIQEIDRNFNMLADGVKDHSIAAVCLKRLQYSCWNKAEQSQRELLNTIYYRWDQDRKPEAFGECCRACIYALLRFDENDMPIEDITYGADHYFADWIPEPRWAKDMPQTTKIGRHTFYRSHWKEVMMENNKPWYLSRGVWGPIIAAASPIVGALFGIDITEAAQGELAAVIVALLTAIGGLVGVVGRVNATEKIGK